MAMALQRNAAGFTPPRTGMPDRHPLTPVAPDWKRLLTSNAAASVIGATALS
jgi:hypothetical protein